MNIGEKSKSLREQLTALDKQENDLKQKIAEFKQLLIEKERKEKRIQELLAEEAELLKKLGA